MCGIIGYVGTRDVVPVLIGGLKKLEYRGYDSAGIAVVTDTNGKGNGVEVVRAEGKLSNLETKLGEKPLHGTFGMGHTRWATHGKPNENNAHPHRDCTGKVVVREGKLQERMRLAPRCATTRSLVAFGMIGTGGCGSPRLPHAISTRTIAAPAFFTRGF